MKPKFSVRIRTQCALVAMFSLMAWRASPQGCPPEPSILTLQMYPGLTITGTVGFTNRIEYTSSVTNSNSWTFLTNIVLPSSPYFFVDVTGSGASQRFYRAVVVPPDVTPVTNMIWISAGSFTMGSPSSEVDREFDEGPQMHVTISQGFWTGKFEVTQREFLTVMGYNPGSGTLLSVPVNNVSWIEASNYCSRLTQSERQAGRIPSGYSYRLPTEAEWEYACRAGTFSRFSYGDDIGYAGLTSHAWYDPNSGNSLHIGGQKMPNPWGLYDMYGNVWEWCLDWYDLYPGGSVTNWFGPSVGSLRIMRGGGYASSAPDCRSANRSYTGPAVSGNPYHGFRIVLVCN